MSQIPDCRNDGVYNQKYLNNEDKLFIRGFDWAVEMAGDNFFENELGDLLDSSDFLSVMLGQELPEYLKCQYKFGSSFSDGQPEMRDVNTYGELIRFKFLQWVEGERDMLITSMIDEMEETEYNAIKENVDGQSAESDGQETE